MKLFRLTLTLSFALSAVSFAQERLVIAPFSGPKATVARGQLLKSVCEEVECLPVPEALTRGKLDARKLRRAKVTGILTGRVVGRRIDIRLLKKVGGRPVFKKMYPVKAGRLSANALDDITGRVADALGGGGAEEDEAVPVARGEADEEGSDEEGDEADTGTTGGVSAAPGFGQTSSAGSSTASADSSDSASGDEAPEFSDPDTASVSSEGPGVAAMDTASATASLFTVQVGVDFLNRKYAIQGLTAGQLRDYNLALFPAPRIVVRATPLAKSPGAVAGLGAEADISVMVGLKSQIAAGGTFPTTMSRIDLGALYNYSPIKGSPLTLTPRLGFRMQSFSVKAGADGTLLDGLPAVSYAGLRLGAGVEHTVAQRVRLFADLGFLPSLSTGAIGQEPFFPGSKAAGFEFGGGVGYLLTPKVELRGSAQLTSYSLKFAVPENPQFVAQGASDRYVGGQISARYHF